LCVSQSSERGGKDCLSKIAELTRKLEEHPSSLKTPIIVGDWTIASINNIISSVAGVQCGQA